MTEGQPIKKKGAKRAPPPALGQQVLGDPEAFFKNFQSARKSYEEKVQELRARRAELEEQAKREIEELEKTFSGEVETSRAELAKVCPLSAGDVAEVPYLRAAYSDRMASVMAVLSLFAYIDFSEPENRIVLEEALDHGGLKLIATYDIEDTQAFLAESEAFCAVVFRGTTTKRDRETDMSVGLEKVYVKGNPTQVRVHKGFYRAFAYVQDEIHADLVQHAGKPIYFAGHSLGGALALIASAAYGGVDEIGSRLAAVYTFGAPRVGGKSFGVCVKAPHYRIVNAFDIVPMSPPAWMFGYFHSGERLLLRNKAKRVVRLQPGLFGFGDALRTVLSATVGLLMWPFQKQLLFLKSHDISRYASRLQSIAGIRRNWS